MYCARLLSAAVLTAVLTLSLSAQTLTVNTTTDTDDGTCDGTHCSLREAINAANLTPISEQIAFAIPGTGVHTIQPTTPLPAVTDTLTIDGLTQPGSTCLGWPPTLQIELDGQLAGIGAGIYGLQLVGNGSTVRGMVINNWGEDGINIESNGNEILCNYIGTNATGTSAAPNGDDGIDISGAQAKGNIIGGPAAVGRNLISGNSSNGVEIEGFGAQLNVIVGNLIGTNALGSSAIPNEIGVKIKDAPSNTVRSYNVANRQVISGNTGGSPLSAGVALFPGDGGASANMNNTHIWGNYIGTDIDGALDIPNQIGIFVIGSETVIGGADPDSGNVISGNLEDGIVLYALSDHTSVFSNRIGITSGTGDPLPNGGNGIHVAGSDDNFIGGTEGKGNVISGNGDNGIYVADEYVEQLDEWFRPDSVIIQGNKIGTDITGAYAVMNGMTEPFGDGIEITGGRDIIIGTNQDDDGGNLISGNRKEGIFVLSTDVENVSIIGNHIGTNASGTAAIPNGNDGVDLRETVGHIVGGEEPFAWNVISGNTDDGIEIAGWNETNPCSDDGLNPGDSPYGGTQILGNHIGTNAAGTASLPNGGDGIEIDYADGNTIGSLPPEPDAQASKTSGDSDLGVASNIISGNDADGVNITCKSYGNAVAVNLIGTDKTGTVDLGNGQHGVQIDNSASNTIGGFSQDEGNVISGNGADGVHIQMPLSLDNVVAANKIGTDLNGTSDLGNDRDGIRAFNSSAQTIGGSWPNHTNTIAFNGGNGITIIADPGPCILKGVLGNSMFNNAGIGIDLGNDGITPNDGDDGDTGENNLQNFPEIIDAALVGGTVRIIYRVTSSTSNSAYPIRVEFYRASTDGEGEAFLGSDSYGTADYTGGPEKTVEFPIPESPVEQNDFVVATATDANNNTSEFTATPMSLPVELLGLTVSGEAGNYRLAWDTGSETNNAGFEIQRATSGDSLNFRAVGFVEASGELEGASYSFVDRQEVSFEASRLFYRLKQIDLDGAFSYSATVAVDRSLPDAIHLHANYPNPFNPSTTIRYELPSDGHVRLAICDMLGREVRLLVDDSKSAGRHTSTFNATGLPSGMYIYRLETNGEVQSGRMLLVK